MHEDRLFVHNYPQDDQKEEADDGKHATARCTCGAKQTFRCAIFVKCDDISLSIPAGVRGRETTEKSRKDRRGGRIEEKDPPDGILTALSRAW